ncbi:hypothetical protein D9M73_137770 [compost metagenome]
MLAQPACDIARGDGDIGPVVRRHLLAHLQRIAAIGEDRGAVGQHHRAAGRALKAGQPGQALGIGPDIFGHIFIGQRHDEAIEPVFCQLGAEGDETGSISGHGELSGAGG